MTSTFTTSQTYTKTAARHIASKVAADLAALSAYYDEPSKAKILEFYQELVEFLSGGYLQSVEYGFQRDDRRVLSMLYEVGRDGSLEDQNSGGVPPRLRIDGAEWFSFLTLNEKWNALSPDEKRRIQDRIAIKRSDGSPPRDGDGAWVNTKTYSLDGVSTRRMIFCPPGGRA